MPRFAVYRNKNLRSSGVFPLLVDVQAELFEDLASRVVIPLSQSTALCDFPLGYLMPTVSFEGARYVLMTPQLAGMARPDLGPHIGSVSDQESTICRAIEFLLQGF